MLLFLMYWQKNQENTGKLFELNTDSIPRLRINETYAALGLLKQSAQNESDGKFIRDNLQEG